MHLKHPCLCPCSCGIAIFRRQVIVVIVHKHRVHNQFHLLSRTLLLFISGPVLACRFVLSYPIYISRLFQNINTTEFPCIALPELPSCPTWLVLYLLLQSFYLFTRCLRAFLFQYFLHFGLLKIFIPFTFQYCK